MKSFAERWKLSAAGARRRQVSLAEFLCCAFMMAVLVRVAVLGGGWWALAAVGLLAYLGGWIGWRRKFDLVEGIIGALLVPPIVIFYLWVTVAAISLIIAFAGRVVDRLW